MAYLLSSQKRDPNTEVKNPLKNPIGRDPPPNLIGKRNSRLMISIRKAGPILEGNSHPKHQEHALSVERKVISKKSVKLRLNPLSIPSLVTKPASKRSSNSQNSTTSVVSPVTKRNTSCLEHPLKPLESLQAPLVIQTKSQLARIVVAHLKGEAVTSVPRCLKMIAS